MSTTAKSFWPKSTKNLNACTAQEKIKIVAGKASGCEAIYIPEVNEVVVLTNTEYVQLADTAEIYDKHIRAVVSANKSSNKQAITNAREKLADFIKSEELKAKQSICATQASVTPLTINDEHVFIEVIELSSKKASYIPRVLVESFRRRDKSYKLKPIASGSSAAIGATASTPLKTENGTLDRDNLKERFSAVKTEIGAKWDLVPEKTGQLPSKYLVRLLGGPVGKAALASDQFNRWLETFDTWIGEINKNLNWVYNDREIRKNKLIRLIDPAQTSADHQSPLLSDQSILVLMQKEVGSMWSKSDLIHHKAYVSNVSRLKWSDFAEDLTVLANNCRKWAKRINDWDTVTQFNKNMHKTTYDNSIYYPDDPDYKRRVNLVTTLNAKAAEADKENTKLNTAKSKRKDEEIVFDEQSLGHVKNEVEYIWGQSSKADDKTFVNDIKSKKWNTFAKSDQVLLENRKTYTKKIKEQKLPQYIFDASAQAQFMRYAYGATGSAVFNPLEGKIGLSAEAKADLALAEGKVNAKWLLPNSEGANMTLPAINKVDQLKWVSVDAGVPKADTFEFDKTFLLPDIVKTLSYITVKWEVFKYSFANHKIQVIGHTDKPGTDTYNDVLSKKRAKVAYELLTYNYNGWFKRFESKEWGDREIQIMLTSVLGGRLDTSRLQDTYWKSIVNKFQNVAISSHIKTPVFPDLKEGCEVTHIKETDIKRGVIRLFNDNGKIGINTPAERETLKQLIQAYMQKGTGNRFLLETSFIDKPYIGKGESELEVKTAEHQREGKNRRVEIHLVESQVVGTDKKVEDIPLGHMRIQIEAYLIGYAGANAMISAELGFSSGGGQLQTKGLRKGDAEKVGKVEVEPNYKKEQSSTATSHTLQNGKNAKYSVDNGVTTKAGAFLGAQATAGMKGLLEWKCPKPEPEFRQPNALILVPTQTCKVDVKQAPEIKKLAGFKDDFAELGSAGYALTGSVGIGLEGEIQIGFDTNTGKFLVKFKAKLVVGLGGGGAFEFSINAKNVYWFVRFVHAQLNDHNFNFVSFMDEIAFDMFSAWTWELLKDGKWVAGGIVALGFASIKLLSDWQKIHNAWKLDFEKSDAADALAKQVNAENFLFSYLSPEVKGRVLYTLSHTSWYTDEEKREQAIIKTLGTVASKNEYKEILEHMGPPLPNENDNDREIAKTMNTMTKRQKEKIKRVGNIDGKAGEMGTSEKRLLSSLDDHWLVGGKELTAFKEWKKKLPDVAPKMTEA